MSTSSSGLALNRSKPWWPCRVDRRPEPFAGELRRDGRRTRPAGAPAGPGDGATRGSVTALAPRLDALVPLLDEEVTHSLPALLDSVERNALPALELMGHTRTQLASVAASSERVAAPLLTEPARPSPRTPGAAPAVEEHRSWRVSGAG